MSSRELMIGGLGAAIGYALRTPSSTVTDDAAQQDISALNTQLSVANQSNDLLRSQLAAVTALKDLATANGTVASAATTALNAQIASLQTQLSAVSAAGGTSFPLAFGPGDPSLAGWVKGRDGLLIHRVLGNVVPTGLRVYTNGITSGNPSHTTAGSGLSVSDIYQRLNPRLVTIGRNVNTTLIAELPLYVDPNTAVLLNFAEDIADDVDFATYASWGALIAIGVRALVIGRNSLMLVPLTSMGYYSTMSWRDMQERLINGTLVGELPTAKWTATEANRVRLSLTHRTARALTLRSVNLVANPLMVANETAASNDIADLSSGALRLRAGAAKLLRQHTSVMPTFYRVSDTTRELETVDVVSAAYAV